MGVSGAGKTTLLDLLATRITMGVVAGEKLVDGRPCDRSFQRKTGYVQQQVSTVETYRYESADTPILGLAPSDCHCSRGSHLQRATSTTRIRVQRGEA
jgi:ABC-type cobalamin/Fe3+-siderophores transport system ATPase subunit